MTAAGRDPAAQRAHSVDGRRAGASVNWRYRLQRVLIKIAVTTVFRVEAEGLEHWPAAPFQIASNHHSGWDPILILAVSPVRPRVTWFGPKEADFSRGFVNRIIGFFEAGIPYHPRHTNLRSAVRAVQHVFDAGGVLAIAPEGTLGFRESELLPLEEGTTLFAARSRVPVVPCAVVGSSLVWFRKRIVVRFGQPISAQDAVDRAGRAALAEQVRAGIVALLPTEEPTYPRRRPAGEFLSDVFNGPAEVTRRRAHMAELERATATDHQSG